MSELLQEIFRKEKYCGIHETGESAEYVSPHGTWAIQVPANCAFTMDPECAGTDPTGRPYPLRFQAADDCDFNEQYGSHYSFLAYPHTCAIHAPEIHADLTSESMTDAVMEAVSAASSFAGHGFVKHTADIAVLSTEVSAEENELVVEYFIACSGYSMVNNGLLILRGLPVSQARKEAKRLLETAINVRGAAMCKACRTFALPLEYDLSFDGQRSISLGSSLQIPIPDGYKATDDNSLLGGFRLIGIIPSDYADFSNAMDARIGMTGLQIPDMIPTFDARYSGKLVDRMIRQCENYGMLSTRLSTRLVQMTDRGIIAWQTMRDDDGKWNFMKILVYVDREVYILSAALNYVDKIATRPEVCINAEFIISHWLSQFDLPGERLYALSADPFVLSGAPAVSLENIGLSEREQEYLDAIRQLFGEQETVRLMDVAKRLNHGTGKASYWMKKLREKGIADMTPRGVITLLR